MWTTLYTLMAIAAWLVWREADDRRTPAALRLFVVQLVANALWTWLFFVWHRGVAALVEIGVLWLLIAATAILFWRIRRRAALLLVPYLAWVGLATALTASLLQRNPAVLGLTSS